MRDNLPYNCSLWSKLEQNTHVVPKIEDSRRYNERKLYGRQFYLVAPCSTYRLIRFAMYRVSVSVSLIQ